MNTHALKAAATPAATIRPWTARSLLFVPGDSPRKLEKALAGEADLIILDLEDSVAAVDAAGKAVVAALAVAVEQVGLL